jgi:hypothetical protein
VIIDSSRATEGLRSYAILAFDLQLIAKSGGYELYRPNPAADAPR